MQRDEGVELVGDPGIELELAGAGARQLFEGADDLGIPQRLQGEVLAGHASGEDQPGWGRLLAVLDGVEAAPRADTEPRVAEVSERGRGGLGERDQQTPLVLGGPLPEGRRRRAREGVERPPAAAVVAGRADVSKPAQLARGQPLADLAGRRQVGVQTQNFVEADRDPAVGRRRPFAPVPVEPPAGQGSDRRHQVPVIRKREYDLAGAVAGLAQVHVWLVGEGAHLDQAR